MKKTHHIACACFVTAFVLALLLSCTPPTPAPSAPAAPADFNVNGSSYACIELRWDDSSNNEDNFIIQRAEDIGFTINVTETTLDANSVRYRDYDGISAGVTRHYRIFARNSLGDSDMSGIVSTTAPAASVTPSGSRIADHTVVNRIRRGTVPVTAIEQAKADLHIGYGHTSHGSQLTSGMSGLVAFANAGNCDGTYSYSGTPGLFSFSSDGSGGALHYFEGDEYGDGDLDHDCGYYPNWVDETHAYLGAPDSNGRGSNHPEMNVIIWSWCGQAAWYEEQYMIDAYLTPMSDLESEYPGVIFVYMTCHLNTTDVWTEQNLLARNQQIRDFCGTTRWLFDFADIETYDPDGVCFSAKHPNDACNYDFNNNGTTEQTDEGVVLNGDRNWALDWQNSHTVDTDWYDCEAAHSQAINANMKAYAAWWLWCRLAGWDGA